MNRFVKVNNEWCVVIVGSTAKEGDTVTVTGHCCFCSLPLTDERSTAVGYGKVCADHFGLSWGARPVAFAEAA